MNALFKFSFWMRRKTKKEFFAHIDDKYLAANDANRFDKWINICAISVLWLFVENQIKIRAIMTVIIRALSMQTFL